jgi:hypothetical protein
VTTQSPPDDLAVPDSESLSTPLNSPVEVGVRVLMILTEVFPEQLDVDRLVLLDHGVLHTADLGGPESLHPDLPVRAGELGVKRDAIEAGLQLLIRSNLAEMTASSEGVEFRAGERADSFIAFLSSGYAATLHDRVTWVAEHFADRSENVLRREMRNIFVSWSEEFHRRRLAEGDFGR